MGKECKLAGSTYGKATRLTARVAAAVGSTTADAEGRAVSLDVAEALAVVALLGCTYCKRLSSITRSVNHSLLSVVLG